jgi:hypothetical protein
MKKAKLLYVGPCLGVNPKTGKGVGSRHRWNGGSWGKGNCIYCLRRLEDVQYEVEYNLKGEKV